MSKQLEEFRKSFVVNLPFKVAALLIALVFWFVILNTLDPVRNEGIPLTLQLRNEEVLMDNPINAVLQQAYTLRSTPITVQVRGTGRAIDAMRDSVIAYVDFAAADNIHAASQNLNFTATVRTQGNFGDGVDFLSVSIGSVPVSLDRVVARDIEVDFNPIGTLGAEFIALWDEMAISPSFLTIRGPSSEINLIDKLYVDVEMAYLQTHLDLGGVRPRAVDVTEATIIPQQAVIGTVDVFLPVFRRGYAHVLQPSYEGGVAPGFGVFAVNVSPSNFAVAGPATVIANMQSINLTPIESAAMQGATTDFVLEYNINDYLPQGVFLLSPGGGRITANVIVEPITERSFTIASENISVRGITQNFQILTQNITFSVSGLQSALADMTSPPIQANLGGLGEGNHQVGLNITLPQGVNIVGSAPTMLVQIGDGENGGGYEPYPYEPYVPYENGGGEPYYDENNENEVGEP
ncbi:MAG: hypothetical protein FWC67_01370 [Defluviitaleaceae bacterium]|nr:hypothetical protein [Defluviitaleaceae bacterium]